MYSLYTAFDKEFVYTYLALKWSTKHFRGGSRIFIFGEAQKIMTRMPITSAKSLTARVQGAVKGPGSSRVLDALSFYLSLIFKRFNTKWNIKNIVPHQPLHFEENI